MGTKPTCNLEEFKDLVKGAIKADMAGIIKYTPFLLEGGAGIGKTSSIFQMVDELTLETGEEFGIYLFDATTRTANDLWGIPLPEDYEGEKVLSWIKDKEFPREGAPGTPKYGIFFCTELTSVQDEQLKVGLLDLLSNGRISGYELPKHWYIVADGNGKRDGNVYSTLGFPIRNRLSILEAKFDKNVWLDWCRGNGIHKSIIEFVSLLPNTNQFITYDPDLEDLSDGAHDDNYVCATPRSWSRVSEKIKLYEHSKDDVSLRHLKLHIQSDIGAEIGENFFNFYRTGYDIEETQQGGNMANTETEVTREVDSGGTLADVLNVGWNNSKPNQELPQINYRTVETLVKILNAGGHTEEQMINMMYYLLDGEIQGWIELSPVVYSIGGEEFKNKLKSHAIINNNLPLLTPMTRQQPTSNKEEDGGTGTGGGLSWD